MTKSQVIKTLELAGYSFGDGREVEVKYGKIHKIITDLENPVFLDENARVVFRKLRDGGIMSVYYKPAETKPDFMIPFSAIYGFEFRLNGGLKYDG